MNLRFLQNARAFLMRSQVSSAPMLREGPSALPGVGTRPKAPVRTGYSSTEGPAPRTGPPRPPPSVRPALLSPWSRTRSEHTELGTAWLWRSSPVSSV